MKRLPVAAVALGAALTLSSLWFYDWRCVFTPSLCLIDFPAPCPKPKQPIGIPRDDSWR